MIAGFEKREVDQRDGSLAAGSDESAVAVLEFTDARGKFESGRSAIKTVGVADGVLVPRVLDSGGVGEKNSRAAMRRRCQRFKAFGSVRVGMDEFCFPILCHAESVTQVPGQR